MVTRREDLEDLLIKRKSLIHPPKLLMLLKCFLRDFSLVFFFFSFVDGSFENKEN
jgi:hypothetical protein